MKKTRMKTTRRTIGYLLVIIGIIIPLLAFLRMSFAQFTSKASYREFEKNQTELKEEEVNSQNEAIKTYNSKVDADAYENGEGSGIVDPFDNTEYAGSYPENIDKNAIFAYLRIPKMDLYKPIYLDATWDHMDQGVAQVDGTSLPVGGVGTKSVIAGHRGWWGDTMFLYLHVLEVGDQVFVEKGGKTLEYRVDNFEVITPSQWQRLLPEKGEDILTLQTCEPFAPPRPYRLLVNCKRVLSENKEASQDQEVSKESSEKLKEDDTKTSKEESSTVKLVNFVIYAITIIGILALIWMIFRFFIYLRG